MSQLAAGSARALAGQQAGLRRPSRGLGSVPKAQAQQQEAPQQAEQQKAGELKLIGPKPQAFTVGEGQLQNIASAAFPTLFRLGSGVFTAGYSVSLVPQQAGQYAVASFLGRSVRESSVVAGFKRPAQPLIIYEFEGCPFCRKVREAVCILDLDVLFYPCPKDGPTWRPEAIAKSGKRQFPFLVDPNTGREMLESDDIIKYMFDTYGDGKVPLGLRLGPLTAISCGLAQLPRIAKGSAYKPGRLPKQPLVFWGYEGSPFCKVVREVLCELELPFVQRSCARGSPKRQQLFAERGHFQVPYLEDPNEGVALFESAAIIEYLQSKYGAAAQ